MRTSPFRLAALFGIPLFILWVVLAYFALPPMIESVYNGQGPSFLSAIMMRHRIEGGIVNPLGGYLQEWSDLSRYVTVSMALFGILGLVLVKALDTRTYFERFVGGARPGMLGAIRMWTCGILLLSTCCERLDTIAQLPLDVRRPLGFMMLLDKLPIGFDRFLTNGTALFAFQCASAIFLFLGMIGYRTRWAVPLAVICAYVWNGILREYSFFWHQNLVPIYVLFVLSFTPCGDGWSVDRLRKLYKNEPVPDAKSAVALYGWSRYACWVPISLLYCWSGLSKLRQSGLMWVNPTNMRNVMYEESLSGRWYPVGQGVHLMWAPDLAFVLLGVVAISGELSYPAVLFSKRARRIIPLLTMGMHIGIIVFQDIVFLDLIALNLILLDFTWLQDAFARRLAKRGPMKILYDGSCQYCRRTIRVLTAMDLFRRLDVVDFRRLDFEAFNRANNLQLSAEGLDREMALVTSGRVYSGFFAFRILSAAIPALWVLAPLLRIPGVSYFGQKVYAYIARRRPRCDDACEVEPVTTAVFSVPELTTTQRFGFAWGVAGLALVMAVVFFNRFEFFPLTAMQLFTGLKTSTVVYYRVIGDHRSGERTPTRLEDGVAAMRFNGRYAQAVEGCFGEPAEKEMCRKFLIASLAAYNKKVLPGDRLTGYEIEKVTWDFHVSPDDPDHGQIAERYVLSPGESSSRSPEKVGFGQ